MKRAPLLLSLLSLTACKSDPPPVKTDPAATSATTTASASSTAQAPSPGGAQEELAQLDQRTPVPLQPMMAWHQKQNMMDHLAAIQEIADGLAKEDWDAIAKASSRIETSPQMAQMCEHMGAGADGFTDLALEFHKRADAIGEAANKKDTKAVLKATAHTLEACTGCHQTFRQEVVDAATWQERTGKSHTPTHTPGHAPGHGHGH